MEPRMSFGRNRKTKHEARMVHSGCRCRSPTPLPGSQRETPESRRHQSRPTWRRARTLGKSQPCPPWSVPERHGGLVHERRSCSPYDDGDRPRPGRRPTGIPGRSRYWGSDSNKNEVQGTVIDQSGNVIHRFGGLWHEGIFCDTLPTPKCIWKPNPQPKDYLLYYGFSSFAMELNELTPNLKPLLPSSDTRLRPDQRMLEEGKVAEADKKKDDVEEIQRERRKQLAKRGEDHVPRFFKKAKDSCGRDVWLTNGTYWNLRDDPGFSNLDNITLW